VVGLLGYRSYLRSPVTLCNSTQHNIYHSHAPPSTGGVVGKSGERGSQNFYVNGIERLRRTFAHTLR